MQIICLSVCVFGLCFDRGDRLNGSETGLFASAIFEDRRRLLIETKKIKKKMRRHAPHHVEIRVDRSRRESKIKAGGRAFAVVIGGCVTVFSLMLILPTARAGTTACFEDPTQSLCKDANNYYPQEEINADLDKLCSEKPFSSACR